MFCEKENRGLGICHRARNLAPQSPKKQKRVDKPHNQAGLPMIQNRSTDKKRGR